MKNKVELKKIDNLRVDLGCGRAKDPDKIGIDWEDYGQEIVWDITKGIPLPDNSCIEIKAHSILEHLYPDDVIFVMKECHRVLKKGGVFNIVVPYAGSEGSFRDPTHKSFWTESTFDYFCGPRKYHDLDPKNEFRFKKIKVEEKDGGAIYAQLTPVK